MILTASAHAQHVKKIYRIGYLSALSQSSETMRSETVRRALRELGYIEGNNLSIDYAYSDGKPNRASDLAAELVQRKVDVIIVAGGDAWIDAARNATKTIPIVMVGGGLDPVEAGHVASLAHPGGNVTGLTILNTELGRKRLDLLKQTAPKILRVAIIYRSDLPSNAREFKEVHAAAQPLNINVQPLVVTVRDNFETISAALNSEAVQGLYVCQGPPTTLYGKEVAGFAIKNDCLRFTDESGKSRFAVS